MSTGPRSAQFDEYAEEMRRELDGWEGLIDEAQGPPSEDQGAAEETVLYYGAPDLLAVVRAVVGVHQPRRVSDRAGDGWVCSDDGKIWPCTTARLVASVVAPDVDDAPVIGSAMNSTLIAELETAFAGTEVSADAALAALDAAQADRGETTDGS